MLHVNVIPIAHTHLCNMLQQGQLAQDTCSYTLCSQTHETYLIIEPYLVRSNSLFVLLIDLLQFLHVFWQGSFFQLLQLFFQLCQLILIHPVTVNMTLDAGRMWGWEWVEGTILKTLQNSKELVGLIQTQ